MAQGLKHNILPIRIGHYSVLGWEPALKREILYMMAKTSLKIGVCSFICRENEIQRNVRKAKCSAHKVGVIVLSLGAMAIGRDQRRIKAENLCLTRKLIRTSENSQLAIRKLIFTIIHVPMTLSLVVFLLLSTLINVEAQGPYPNCALINFENNVKLSWDLRGSDIHMMMEGDFAQGYLALGISGKPSRFTRS